MYAYYFTFRSMTQAQQATLELKKLNVDALFMRAPNSVSGLGCGYAVRVSAMDSRRTAAILRAFGIPYERIVRLNEDGTVKEVFF